MNKPVVSPGEVLSAQLKKLGIGQIILSSDTGITPKTISYIINGKTGISPKIAILLEQYLPPRTAEDWLEIDYKWRLATERAKG